MLQNAGEIEREKCKGKEVVGASVYSSHLLSMKMEWYLSDNKATLEAPSQSLL